MPDIFFPLDDAYITLHNARVLLTGVDHAYGVSALVGATSLVHLLLVALLGLALPLPWASALVSALAAGAYAVGLMRLAQVLGATNWIAALFAATGLLMADAPLQLVNGLETSLAMAAVTWALVLAREHSRTALPILCGLLPFLRPELAVLSALLLATRAFTAPRTVVRDLVLASAAAAPFLVWMYASTGSIIPQTASAKRAYFGASAFGDDVGAGISFFLTALWASSVGPLLVGSILLPMRAPFAWAARLFIALVLVAILMTLPAAALHNSSRYLYPLLPAALYLVIAAAQNIRAAKIVAPVFLLSTLVASPSHWRDLRDEIAFAANEYKGAAVAATQLLPPDARILVHDAGYMAWATRFHLIDVVGLKTPSAIDEHRRWTLPSAGADRGKAIDSIARRTQPSHLIVLDDPFWGGVATGLRDAGWGLAALRTPPGPRGYFIYALTPPSS